jgi:hypothetical protein
MIILPNIDSKIWDIQYKALDILKEYQDTGKIVVDLNTEGPDSREVGLYELLDYIVDKFNIDKSQIEIHTSNQLEKHPDYAIKHYWPYQLGVCNNFVKNKKFPDKKFDTNFKKFGLFIGRLNSNRLELLNEIHNYYQDHSLYTCHYDRDLQFNRPHVGVNEMIQNSKDWHLISQCLQTLSECPIKLEEINEYPIVSPAHMNISKVYHNFFVELVAETYFTGKLFFPSEKTWRPIILKTPFIIQGPQNHLQNLKKLGFQTFDKWWNEGYSEDPADYQVTEIKKNLELISQWSTSKIKKVYQNMKPVLENNFECMQNLSPADFKRVFGYE